MSARATNLSIVSLNIGTSAPGTDVKVQAVDGNIGIEMLHDDGRGMSESIYRATPVKRTATGSIRYLRRQSGINITPLDITVFSVDGNAQLGRVVDASISFEVETEDGSAATDEWTFANRLSQNLRMSGTLLADTGSNIARTRMAGALSGTAVVCSFATGSGNSVTFDGRLIRADQVSRQSGITMWSFEAVSNAGTPSVSGYSAFLNGIGAATYFLSMNAGDGSLVSLPALFTRGEIEVARGRIITENYEFANRGAVTIT